ncbi:MAG TPA: hypothetical protein VGP89_17850 [Candidatus Angelobacter sp.]|jgi:hypothetical protein|nr:hypothetical protein [Candidatus Angelobacter sp.]
MENTRTLYGGGVLLNGNSDINILGFNAEGNPVVAHVPIGKLLNTITHLSENFKPVTTAAAVFCYTYDGKVLWTVVDDKLKKFADVIPIDKCWGALEQIGKFAPVNKSQLAA